MRDRQQTVNLNPNSTSGDEKDDKINQTEKNTDSPQDQTSLDTKSNPPENTTRKALQIYGLSHSDLLIRQT